MNVVVVFYIWQFDYICKDWMMILEFFDEMVGQNDNCYGSFLCEVQGDFFYIIFGVICEFKVIVFNLVIQEI